MYSSASAENEWESILKNYGLQLEVFTRERKDSNAKEMMAVAILPHPTQEVFEVLTNHEDWKNFIPYMDQSKILIQNHEQTIVYKHFDFPLIDDRDTIEVIVSRENTAQHSYEIEWTTSDTPNLVMQKKDTVRLSRNTGKWIIEPYDTKKTKLTFIALADLGGNIPRWIVNLAKGLAVPKVLKAIRKQLEQKSMLVHQNKTIEALKQN